MRRWRGLPAVVFVTSMELLGCGRITHSIGQIAGEAGSGGIPGTGESGVSGSAAGSHWAGSSSAGSHWAGSNSLGADASGGGSDGGGPDPRKPDATDSQPRSDASGGLSGDEDDAGSDLVPCVGERIAVEARQLDIYMMVDAYVRGISSALGTASSGISEFVDDPRSSGTGVGIRFFGLSCDSEVYENPAVEVAPLPGNSGAIKRSYPPVIFSTSPVVPALEGAVAHARERARAPGVQDRKQVVFLVTATGPLDPFCGFGVDRLGAVASQGLLGTPRIETYVIGLGFLQLAGGNLADLDALRAFLDSVAREGGSVRAFMAVLDTTTGPSLAESLQEARAAAAPCEYRLPAQDSGGSPIDPSLVALEYQTQNGAVHRVPHVSSAASCAGGDSGWYYRDPSRPDWIAACGAACETLKSDWVQQVFVALGCGS